MLEGTSLVNQLTFWAYQYTFNNIWHVNSLLFPGLVVLTAMAGYAVAPGALDASTLLWSCTGIAMCSGAANSINQVTHRDDAVLVWAYF